MYNYSILSADSWSDLSRAVCITTLCADRGERSVLGCMDNNRSMQELERELSWTVCTTIFYAGSGEGAVLDCVYNYTEPEKDSLELKWYFREK